MNLRQFLNGWSSSLVNLVANVAPWIAPLPTAWLVYYRTMVHLHWPQWVAISAGVTLELLGVAILATALDLYDYNGNKRKSDPRAPFWLALVLVVLYFITALLLTVVLDVSPTMARLAPALFPVLSVASFALLALRSDHERRLTAIAQGKADARSEYQRKKEERARQQAQPTARPLVQMDGATKKAQVVQLAELHPTWSRVQLASEVGCSASTVTRALQGDNHRHEEAMKYEHQD